MVVCDLGLCNNEHIVEFEEVVDYEGLGGSEAANVDVSDAEGVRRGVFGVGGVPGVGGCVTVAFVLVFCSRMGEGLGGVGGGR